MMAEVKTLVSSLRWGIAAAILTAVIGLVGVDGSSPAFAQTDTTAPTVSSIAITSDPNENDADLGAYAIGRSGGSIVTSTSWASGVYRIGDDVQVTVTFSENVTVTGAPQLELNIGGSAKTAEYDSTDGSKVIFSYTVAEGHRDANGIAIGANKLTLNSGSIKDAANNPATLTHSAVADQDGHKVDGVRPRIDRLFLLASTGGSDGAYSEGEELIIAAEFTEDHPRGSATGPPQIKLDFDGADKMAQWDPSLIVLNTPRDYGLFSYVIKQGDLGSDGVVISADSIDLNGGFIRDPAGNDAVLTHAAVAASSTFIVDAVAPTVSSITITSDPGDDDSYGTGDTIEVTVTFSENMSLPASITCSPDVVHCRAELELDIGGTPRTADYQSHAGADVVFSYTVQASDADENGIAIGANKLTGQRIRDAAGKFGSGINDADLSHAAVTDDGGHRVARSSVPAEDEPGTVELSSVQPQVGTTLTATLSDPDGDITGLTWSAGWTATGPASATYTPVAADVGNYLQATVSYNDGHGSGKSAQAVSANPVEAAPVTPNHAPDFPSSESGARTAAENTPAGQAIGARVAATDSDNDTLTYALDPTGAMFFDIDQSTGQLRTKASLDHARTDSYTVTVTATDPSLASATQTVIITVTQARRTGGGGGGGGGFGGPILSVKTVVVGEAPAGLSFGFALACANALGAPVVARTFPVAAGREYGTIVPAGLTCTLTVTDAAGATAVDGLFTDVVIPPAGYKTTVTFTFGPVPTAVDPESETVVEEGAVSLTIPEGSRDAPYAVLLETGKAHCEGGLDLDGESISCYGVTVFDADGEEETDVTLLVPATITITLGAALVEELGGLAGVRAARERGELRMLQRADADSPWAEIPFTVQETDDGAIQIVVAVQTFSDFALITSEPRLAVLPLHADWNVVAWDGADGAAIPDALGDIAGQVDVIYQWVADSQTWRSHRPDAPAIRSDFDSFTRGASYWIRVSEAVEWTIVAGPLEPPMTDAIRLHHRWTQVVWRGADGAPIGDALGDAAAQFEVVYHWDAETQSWRSYRPDGPAFLSAFDTFTSGATYWIAVSEAVDWTVVAPGP